jgi:hypothetical protein
MSITGQIREYLRARLERAREGIVANIESKGIKASGRTQNSLEVVFVSDTHAQIVQRAGKVAPYQTLEVGRAPGKVPYDLQTTLYQWSVDKGISFCSDKERLKFANALKWEIAREGTKRHKRHEDVYSTILADTEQALREDVRQGVLGIAVKSIKVALFGG